MTVYDNKLIIITYWQHLQKLYFVTSLLLFYCSLMSLNVWVMWVKSIKDEKLDLSCFVILLIVSPYIKSVSTINEDCPPYTAKNKGVNKKWLFCVLTLAPACMRASTILTCPYEWSKTVSGVRSSTSGVSGLLNIFIMTVRSWLRNF